MKLSKQKCDNCRYHFLSEDEREIGCRLNPPSHNQITGMMMYPRASKSSWCGQWKRQKRKWVG